jgi:hypothetical protein
MHTTNREYSFRHPRRERDLKIYGTQAEPRLRPVKKESRRTARQALLREAYSQENVR